MKREDVLERLAKELASHQFGDSIGGDSSNYRPGVQMPGSAPSQKQQPKFMMPFYGVVTGSAR